MGANGAPSSKRAGATFNLLSHEATGAQSQMAVTIERVSLVPPPLEMAALSAMLFDRLPLALISSRCDELV